MYLNFGQTVAEDHSRDPNGVGRQVGDLIFSFSGFVWEIVNRSNRDYPKNFPNFFSLFGQ
jgi:hypothetical protein